MDPPKTLLAAACLLAAVAATPLAASAASPAEAVDQADSRTRPVAKTGPVRPGHRKAMTGTDEKVGAGRREKAADERDVLLAATWHLDPELLVPLPTDSEETAVARRELAEINTRLGDVLAAYERARAAAEAAAAADLEAREALARARVRARVAAVRYEADRELFVSVINEAYTTNTVGPLAMLLSADSDQDLVTAMTLLQEMGRTQSSAAEAAQRSRDMLDAAAAVVAQAEQRAEEKLEASRAALFEARTARDRVLADVRRARTLLEDSVLVDQIASDVDLDREAAEAALDYARGHRGGLSFPLPANAAYVDQDNWGRRSRHWAQVHTGDDFSAGCGTPVLAVTDGTVMVRTDQRWSGPWLVLVETGAGELSTWYAHLQSLLVSDGQPVTAGQPIGVVGARGNASGCHLHFEVHPAGGTIYEDHTDPVAWLRAVGVYPDQGPDGS